MKNTSTLPMPVDGLIPHRPPICLVTRLLASTGQSGVVEARITPDNILLDEDGNLEPLAMMELIAQASAAVKGYNDLCRGKGVKQGFLVDIRDARFTGRCAEGDRLHIHVEITHTIGGFSVVKGEVRQNTASLATATLKLWVPEEDIQ